MPTNESYTISNDMEEMDDLEDQNAERFLQEMGLLIKIEDEECFGLNFRSNQSTFGDIQTIEKASVKGQNCASIRNFKIFEDPFEYEFNPADTLQQQLERDPLPEMFDNSNEQYVLCSLPFSCLDDIDANSQTREIIELSKTLSSQPLSQKNETNNKNQIAQIKDDMTKAKPEKKKLTEFGYLLQRKGFRLLRKYYKDKFEDFAALFDYKKRAKSITPNEISHIILKFIEHEFAAIIPMLTRNELTELQDCLKKIVLSDRSNKKEPMIAGIDFTVVRNLFGKYTGKNMKIFMKNPANSFLYTHFYLINGRYE